MSIDDRQRDRGASRSNVRGRGPCRTGALTFGLLAGLSLWPALCGCEFLQPACTPSVEPGVTVLLTDEQGAAIEGATLTLTSGAFTEVMRESGDGRYTGADERPGTYGLMIEADGFAPRSVEGIQVGAGQCHVVTANLEFTLLVEENGS